MWADNADWESRKISLFIVLLLSSSCSPWPHVRSLDRTIMLSGFRRCLIAPYWLRPYRRSLWAMHNTPLFLLRITFASMTLAKDLHNSNIWQRNITSTAYYYSAIWIKFQYSKLCKRIAKEEAKCVSQIIDLCSRQRMARDCRFKSTFAATTVHIQNNHHDSHSYTETGLNVGKERNEVNKKETHTTFDLGRI